MQKHLKADINSIMCVCVCVC